MFDSSEDSDEVFKSPESPKWGEMRTSGIAYIVSGAAVLFVLLICCCRRRRSRGQIITPPAANISTTVQCYPQQPYAPYPVQVTAYPAQNANIYPNPTPYPGAGTPYPAAAAPYPAAAAPYPTTTAPYPAAAAPYPIAPSAPDVNALPPSYDQVMTAEGKQAPYNPHPH